MSDSIYVPDDESWATPCCGVRLSGDIVVGETVYPYCEKSFQSLSDENDDVDDDDCICDSRLYPDPDCDVYGF